MKLHARPALLCLGALAALSLAAACSGSATDADEPLAPVGPAFNTAAPPPPPPPPPDTTASDSVQAGYGSGATGGLEYEQFEYEPETGTEYVVTPDTQTTKDP